MVLSLDALFASAATPPISVPGSPFYRPAASSDDIASRDDAMVHATGDSDIDQPSDEPMEMAISLPTNSNIDNSSIQPAASDIANTLGRLQSQALDSRLPMS